jgi:hypothetical protein
MTTLIWLVFRPMLLISIMSCAIDSHDAWLIIHIVELKQ